MVAAMASMPTGPPSSPCHDGEEAAVERVEAELVDAFECEGLLEDFRCEFAGGADDGEIADAAEESVGNAGVRGSGGGDLVQGVVIGGELQ